MYESFLFLSTLLNVCLLFVIRLRHSKCLMGTGTKKSLETEIGPEIQPVVHTLHLQEPQKVIWTFQSDRKHLLRRYLEV